jgi:site-specific DNA-methyltransferase (adenine-specific)
LAFFGTRTYDIGTMAIRMAGFEIRDQIMWLYGSGFPKSLNVGKTIEKFKKTGNASWNGTGDSSNGALGYSKLQKEQGYRAEDYSNRHQSKIEINNQYEGWGTALKPANEPICLARKPLSEKSIAENVLKWGTGGINVDGCRVGSENISSGKSKVVGGGQLNNKNTRVDIEETFNEGRFPANLILECICDEVIKGEKGEVKKSGGSRDGLDITHEWGYGEINRTTFTDKGDIHTNPMCPCRLLDNQSGSSSSQKRTNFKKDNTIWQENTGETDTMSGGFTDKGGASRFFYQAKVSKSERNMGLDGFEETQQKGHGLDRVCMNEGCGVSMLKPENCNCEEPDWRPSCKKNTHPTVKPINLMSYLCRLITPEGGIVLDTFMGSGSTGIAAQLEGFRFVGMEMDEDYFKIATARIENYEKYRKFMK